MSNIVAGVIRGQIPYLDEHIAQKKAIFERYKEGLKDLPVKMNPFDADKSQPNYWLSCMIIDEDAMCQTVRGEKEALYISEPNKSCPTEILEAIATFNAEGRPIWKPMHMQPIKAELFMDFHVTGEKPVEQEIDDYIVFFNEQRPAYSLNYLTPKQYRETHTA